MATKVRAVPPGDGERHPTKKQLDGFVTGEAHTAQMRTLGRNDENCWDDYTNEVRRLAMIAIEQCKPGTSWKALAQKLIRSRNFVELVPQLAPGEAPDSKWVRRQIHESYGEVALQGLTDPDEERREAMSIFILRGGHVRDWLVHHEGIASLQQPLFEGSDFDDHDDDPNGTETVADERSEAESEAVEAQIDFGALEWERLTPRQRIVGETLAYLGLRPYEIAQRLGVSKATISSDMNAIRDWLLWHSTKPPPDPPDPTDVADEDIA